LFDVMTQEWFDLAQAIAALGAKLSAEAAANGSAQLMGDMQAFDLLSQRAHAQFYLLERIGQELGADGSSGATQEALIEAVPFLEMRRRLLGALRGYSQSRPDDPAGGEDTVCWFE
jgi:hypothetical protein